MSDAMKIIAAITSVMPDDCKHCQQWYELAGYAACSITFEYIGNIKNGERHRLCPLITAEQWAGEWRARLAELEDEK